MFLHVLPLVLLFLHHQPTQSYEERCNIRIVSYSTLNFTSLNVNNQPTIFRPEQPIVDSASATTITDHFTNAMHDDVGMSIGSSKHWSKPHATGTSKPTGTKVDELLSLAINSPHDVTGVAVIGSMPTATTTTTTTTTIHPTPPLPSHIIELFRRMHQMDTLQQDDTIDTAASTPSYWNTKIFASSPGSGLHFHRDTTSFTYHATGAQVKWLTYASTTLIPLEHTARTSIHDWYTARIYPLLEPSELPHECTSQPGDLIYIPEGTWQAYLVEDNKGPVFLARSHFSHYNTVREHTRQQAQAARKAKSYIQAYTLLMDLTEQTNKEDLESLFQLSTLMSKTSVRTEFDRATVSEEMRLKKSVMLAMQNRTCDVLHSFGRTMMREQNYIQARQLARKCVSVCDRMSKCYELLSQGVEGVHGEATFVSTQAIEMAREYKRAKKSKLVFGNGYVLKFD